MNVLLAMVFLYNGNFSQVNAPHDPCKEIFETINYESKLHLTGSGGTTAVVFFANPDRKGFFHEMSLVGRNGGMGDVLFEKKLQKNGYDYSIVAEGIFDRDFLVLNFTVDARNPLNGLQLCQATAEYSGF